MRSFRNGVSESGNPVSTYGKKNNGVVEGSAGGGCSGNCWFIKRLSLVGEKRSILEGSSWS